MKVKTKKCPGCGEEGELEVSESGYIAWKGGMLIQRAMPELTVDQREQLITGYHGECWEKLFSDEEKA